MPSGRSSRVRSLDWAPGSFTMARGYPISPTPAPLARHAQTLRLLGREDRIRSRQKNSRAPARVLHCTTQEVTMEPFRDSLAGRLLTIAGALPLAAGASVLWDSGGMGTVVIITAVFAATLLGICGLGLALEDYGGYAVAGV